MTGALSVVSVERRDNVVFLDFVHADVQRPAVSLNPPAAGPLPARLSPRPVRVLRRRFARSQLAVDLRDWGWLVGLLVAGLICVAALDLTFQDLAHLIPGETR